MATSTTQSPPSDLGQPRRRRLELSGAQVGASAGAAVTSALGASLFGATGTIAGAAVGSVISTIAGAIYTRSLHSAGEKLRETTVVVRKVPLRSTGAAAVPADLPEVEAGAERQAGEVTQPVDEPPTQAVDLTGTTALPVAEQGDPASGAAAGPPGLSGRKRLLVLLAVMVSGFVLAMGGITLAEKLIGHPVSGGSGGTSLGEAVTGSSGSTSDDRKAPEPQSSATPTSTTSEEPEATGSAEPSETSSPEATTTPEPSATSEPTASETAPTTEPSQSAGGSNADGGDQGAGAAPGPTATPGD